MNQQLAKYGAYIGAAMIAASFILYLIGVNNDAITQNIIYIIMIFGLFMSLKHFRDVEMNGYIEFGKTVSSGIIITLLFSVLFSVYQYLIFKFDVNAIDNLMEQTYQKLFEQGKTEEEIEKLMTLSTEFLSAGILAISSFLTHAIIGGLFTLLIAAFIKRPNPNPFEEIEN